MWSRRAETRQAIVKLNQAYRYAAMTRQLAEAISEFLYTDRSSAHVRPMAFSALLVLGV